MNEAEFEREWRILQQFGLKESCLRQKYVQKRSGLRRRCSGKTLMRRRRKKYGDPPGPTYEALRKTKSDRQIIESASRPIEYPDDGLTLRVPCVV